MSRRRSTTPSPPVKRTALGGDIVITLGAGSVGTLPDRLIEALA
jgi:hypothetical protein